jgi:hypothetical protein
MVAKPIRSQRGTSKMLMPGLVVKLQEVVRQDSFCCGVVPCGSSSVLVRRSLPDFPAAGGISVSVAGEQESEMTLREVSVGGSESLAGGLYG